MLSGNFYFSISGDLVSLSRYAFKLTFENEPGSNYQILLDNVDITSYLEVQLGRSLFFTSGTFPSTMLENDFDLMQVVSDMKILGNDEWEKIVKQGLKMLTIKRLSNNDVSVDVVLHKYIKYSHLNR